MAHSPTDQDWQSIAEQASTEMDPAKLTQLVDELCASIDARHKGAQIEPNNESLDQKP
jgi:hypothetical protein